VGDVGQVEAVDIDDAEDGYYADSVGRKDVWSKVESTQIVVGCMYLHCANTEDCRYSDLFRCCHLEPPQHWHWENNHNDVQDQVDDRDAQVCGFEIDTGAARDRLVPRIGER
jgi:hypothetical protein